VCAFGDDPLDAGGRTCWLTGVTAADSVKYLTSLLHQHSIRTSIARSARAPRAIALHRDPSADTVLDQIATSDTDSATLGREPTRRESWRARIRDAEAAGGRGEIAGRSPTADQRARSVA
jgi:hypothetical protein